MFKLCYLLSLPAATWGWRQYSRQLHPWVRLLSTTGGGPPVTVSVHEDWRGHYHRYLLKGRFGCAFFEYVPQSMAQVRVLNRRGVKTASLTLRLAGENLRLVAWTLQGLTGQLRATPFLEWMLLRRLFCGQDLQPGLRNVVQWLTVDVFSHLAADAYGTPAYRFNAAHAQEHQPEADPAVMALVPNWSELQVQRLWPQRSTAGRAVRCRSLAEMARLLVGHGTPRQVRRLAAFVRKHGRHDLQALEGLGRLPWPSEDKWRLVEQCLGHVAPANVQPAVWLAHSTTPSQWQDLVQSLDIQNDNPLLHQVYRLSHELQLAYGRWPACPAHVRCLEQWQHALLGAYQTITNLPYYLWRHPDFAWLDGQPVGDYRIVLPESTLTLHAWAEQLGIATLPCLAGRIQEGSAVGLGLARDGVVELCVELEINALSGWHLARVRHRHTDPYPDPRLVRELGRLTGIYRYPKRASKPYRRLLDSRRRREYCQPLPPLDELIATYLPQSPSP